MAKDKDEDETKTEEGSGDGSAEGQEGAGGEEKKGSKKLIIIIGIALFVLIGAGAGLYFTGMLDSLLGKEKHVECAEGDEECLKAQEEAAKHGGEEKGHGKEAKKGGGGHGEEGGPATGFLEIPTMIVNLNSPEGSPRYLRLSVQLELEDPADLPAVQAVIPRVVDQFQTYLRELRVKDLRGSGGIYRLQMELLWRVNQAAAPAKIKDVLFQEILIQ